MSSRALGWASTAPGWPSSSRVTLQLQGEPPLLQGEPWHPSVAPLPTAAPWWPKKLQDDFHGLGKQLRFHDETPQLQEVSPLSVVSLHCSRERFGCSWVTLQCSRLTLYGPRMCSSGLRMSFYDSRMSLHSYRVSLRGSWVSLAAPGWSSCGYLYIIIHTENSYMYLS